MYSYDCCYLYEKSRANHSLGSDASDLRSEDVRRKGSMQHPGDSSRRSEANTSEEQIGILSLRYPASFCLPKYSCASGLVRRKLRAQAVLSTFSVLVSVIARIAFILRATSACATPTALKSSASQNLHHLYHPAATDMAVYAAFRLASSCSSQRLYSAACLSISCGSLGRIQSLEG